MNNKVFLIKSTGWGSGDDQLGEILMANLLRLLGENENRPASIFFLNAGVKLCCSGSPVLEHLKRLQSMGVELLCCTTCLEFFDITEKLEAGKPTTMVKVIQAMLENAVVTL